jgi:hypothetical protein
MTIGNKNKRIANMGMSDMVSIRKEADFSLKGNTKQPEIPKVIQQKEVIVEALAVVKVHEPVYTEVYKADINLLIPQHQTEVRKSLRTKTRTQVAVFSLFVFMVSMFFQSAFAFSSGLRAKENAQGFANLAIEDLKEVEQLIGAGDFSAARTNLESAQRNFLLAKQDINDLGIFVNSALKVTSSGKSGNALLNAGQDLTQAGIELSKFLSVMQGLKVTPLGVSSGEGFSETLTIAEKHLNSSLKYLQNAEKELKDVDPDVLPKETAAKFSEYMEVLALSSDGLEKTAELLSFVHAFVGKGQKNILLLFQNNNELRATGGFIGTYGYYKFNNGKIESQKISSIYDLDGQVREKIAPPGPFHDLTDRWGLRDSNWFVDFKDSAKKASDFYERTGFETPDAVIAVTPEFFIDLLEVTGPIYFPKYNLTLDSENFREQIQLNTSVLYDKEINTPKQMLADFAPLLLQKIGELESGTAGSVFSVFTKNLAAKNILIYDRDRNVQATIEKYNWAGKIVGAERDYLAVFSTNLGGRKTDLGIQQDLKLESEVQEDGSVINTVTLTRNHQLDLTEKAKNISYLRFLVPKGSELLGAKGFVQKPYYKSDGSGYIQDTKQPFKTDADLLALEKGVKVDGGSGTVIGEESGKTVFANWVETEPGDSTTVVIKYKLPFKLSGRRHSLVVQKQPGSPNVSFRYILWSHKPIVWTMPLEAKQEAGALRFEHQLNSDLFIGAVLGDN